MSGLSLTNARAKSRNSAQFRCQAVQRAGRSAVVGLAAVFHADDAPHALLDGNTPLR